ncbi:MAG: hypothetical protein JJ850_10425 [Kordiimonadaceae bacterium]|nr:hypothetical protein [Kordiimonadaceae bacterium]MBO6569550.1 hypothetical protein [Kordiimonadaceae bacterium]MBO6965025.1 hypothetical protein [Kordiimonadaceae bacterium]
MLDSPYDRNQMQTLFAMLGDTRVQGQVMLPKAKRKPAKPAVAIWWQRLKARIAKTHAPSAAPNFPQRAVSPRVPRDAARWRAPDQSASVEFYALLDDMGARHQAAARRDHLIRALEANLLEKNI